MTQQYPPVPYISQIDAAPTRNDCGPATALMLARWVGRGLNDTVADWSQRIDPAQDGTTTAQLASMLRTLGCTPVTGQAVPFPRIELVTYGKLPKQNPTFSGQTFLHWIVRLSSTTYHDPLWRGTSGANLSGTTAQLDGANYGASYTLGIQERPVTQTNLGLPRTQYSRVVHVLPPDATEARLREVASIAYPARQTVGFSYDDAGVGALDERTAILWDIPVDKRASFTAFYAQHYPGVRVEWRGNAGEPPPPPPQPPPASGRNWLGVNAMYSTTAAREALQDGAALVVTIENVAGALELAREFPSRWIVVRKALDHGYLPDPADFVARTGVRADWPANIIIVGLNEDDQIAFNANVQRRYDWDINVARRIRAINPNVKYAAWVYPPACNEPGEAQLSELMRRTYAPAFNTGELWIDTHPYGRDEGTLWSVNAKGEAEYRWFEGRIEHLFTCCGFDRAAKGRMIYTECGVDKGSVGGFNQIGFTGEQFERWLMRFHEVTRDYLSIIAGAALFQYGDNERGDRWAGYELRTPTYRPVLQRVYAALAGEVRPPDPPPPAPEPPAPEPPPPITTPASTVLGVHAMTNTGVAGGVVNDGCPAVLVMDNGTTAAAIADAFPQVVVLYRRFWPHGFRPTPDQIADAMPRHPRIRYCLLNEWDNWGNTPADIAARADVEIRAAQIMRNRGGYGLALAGGWSHGTPDMWSGDIARVFREKYAPAYNTGQIGMDWHLYSPSVSRPMDQWYEGRWRRVFDDDIGFNPSIRAIYCSETGVDEPNGRGGFPAVGATQQEFLDWCRRWLAYQSQPVRGKPSPLVASVIYQHGGNGDPQWNRFEIAGYM